MNTHKITVTEMVDHEKQMLLEALGFELELNDCFLDRYCSEHVRTQLSRIDETDRADILHECITGSWVNGSPASSSDGVWLDCSEIEIQIDSVDELDDPDEWTINGDLAYYYIGYGISYAVDDDKLTRLVNEHIQDN